MRNRSWCKTDRIRGWARRLLGCAALLALVGLHGSETPAEAAGKKITVHNWSVKKRTSLWFAEYHVTRSGAERKGGPMKVESGKSRTFQSASMPIGASRHIRWLTHKDLPKNYGNGKWDGIKGRKRAATGVHAIWVTDHKQKGTYRGYYRAEMAFQKFTDFLKKFGEAVKDVVDEVSTAGDPCVVHNTTENSYYITEYQRKTLHAGRLERIQGGSGKAWRVRPGRSLSFKKGKLKPGFTSRWIVWRKDSSSPNTIEGRDFDRQKGRKPNYKGINKIYIARDTDGVIKGYTTVQWQAKRLTMLKLAHTLIKTAWTQPSRSVRIPDWVFKLLGLDKISEGAIEQAKKVIDPMLDGVDAERWMHRTLVPEMRAMVPTETIRAGLAAAFRAPERATQVLGLLDPLEKREGRAAEFYSKARALGVVPNLKALPGPRRMRSTKPGAEKYMVFGVVAGVVLEVPFNVKGQDLTLSVTVTLSADFWFDARGKIQHVLTFSIGPSLTGEFASGGRMDPSAIQGGIQGVGLNAFMGAMVMYVQDPSNPGNHAVGITVSYSHNSDVDDGTRAFTLWGVSEPLRRSSFLSNESRAITVEPFFAFRGAEEEGGAKAMGGGLLIALEKMVIEARRSKTMVESFGNPLEEEKAAAEESPWSVSVGLGYSWGLDFPR